MSDATRAELSELGRLYAGRRRQVEQTCAYCGARYVGIATRRYCKPSHRVIDHRRKKRQQPTDPG